MAPVVCAGIAKSASACCTINNDGVVTLNYVAKYITYTRNSRLQAHDKRNVISKDQLLNDQTLSINLIVVIKIGFTPSQRSEKYSYGPEFFNSVIKLFVEFK